ncbi:UVR8 [Symbiodinium natans]|uniref:UVR8 protein n=1 Tax=Symbiodinium natans TaxID=878477 RepID=A0A812H049_9DINO|nr:UVR8 [Symbiodinium natans]
MKNMLRWKEEDTSQGGQGQRAVFEPEPPAPPAKATGQGGNDPWGYQLEEAVSRFTEKEGDRSKVWLFIDYMSLHQYKRDDHQQRIFKLALDSMHILYAHEVVRVEIINKLTPPDRKAEVEKVRPTIHVYQESCSRVVETPIYDLTANSVPYSERGWCQAEKEWANLRETFAAGDVPLPPELFSKQMDLLKFTHRNDADLVKKLQEEVFHIKVTGTTKLNLKLSQQEVPILCQALKSYKNLEMVIVRDTPLGCAGAVAILQTGARHIFLDACHLGDDEARAMAEVLRQTPSVENLTLRNTQISRQGVQELKEAARVFNAVDLDIHSNEAFAVAAGEDRSSEGNAWDLDVRKMHWYSHYRHTVFAMIQACHDEGAEGIALMAVAPELQNVVTLKEWPCLEEDLPIAYNGRKYPFFDSQGREVIPFSMITFRKVALPDLREELETATRRGKYAIIASCSEAHFQEAEKAIRKHNTDRPPGHGLAKRAWATAWDVYGGSASHPAEPSPAPLPPSPVWPQRPSIGSTSSYRERVSRMRSSAL